VGLAIAALSGCGDDDAPPTDAGTPATDARTDDASTNDASIADASDGEPDASAPDASGSVVTTPPGPLAALFDGDLLAADYWTDEPAILSATLGFSDIVGILGPLNEENVRAAGGAWSTAGTARCADTPNAITTTSTQMQVGFLYQQRTPYEGLRDGALGLDGIPVVFSWPMDTSTLDLDDFRVTLNTGEIVSPYAVSPFPCGETNERNTAVIFGEWGNRLPSGDPGTRYPARVEVVEGATPLLLVGPDARVESAVGLFWENRSSPYDPNNGPRLVGAKLNRVEERSMGEGISGFNPPFLPPNDEHVLYDEGDFRLRVLTSGGFSPDGVTGVRPTDYETFFVIHARGADGGTVRITEVGETYAVMGGSLRVVGLADLGAAEGGDVVYDACYGEDRDNYIDVILVGDEAAARNVTHVEIPSLEGGYRAFYNPGGPGSTPFSGVTYTSPGPADLEPVTIALDDPRRVTRMAR